MEDECSMREPRDISDQLSGLKQHPQESLDDVVRRLAAEVADDEYDDPMKTWKSCPVYKLEVLWKDQSRESAE
ncbi:hypothetical protein FGU65_12590 [Methanoculleus sp. FWC-SCC1]|uniref:Uncharacterized protein n=1 Tax=Methanoculleus frigidifontis TaxID=2584085 RepID=A0ABT8MCP2_9EURY|nr:hypothetical protein [Methanoculleus sp. FWC-SCC1]MDN7025708.1 hypothetical protein [Methanoculleus sp. FWC-SCC1]